MKTEKNHSNEFAYSSYQKINIGRSITTSNAFSKVNCTFTVICSGQIREPEHEKDILRAILSGIFDLYGFLLEEMEVTTLREKKKTVVQPQGRIEVDELRIVPFPLYLN